MRYGFIRVITGIGLLVGSTAVPSPPAGAQAATTHVWAFGDPVRCKEGSPISTATRDVVAVDGAPILILGDVVAPAGAPREFTDCFEPVWGSLKSRMRPVPGNHEYNTPGAQGYYDYFDGIDPWYSWETNGWRMYALNSMCGMHGGCEPGDPQYRWLENQLRTAPGRCQAAYWHHPRWSQGGHGNIDKMAPAYELLVRYGVELLLVGHENGSYQRYAALDAAGARTPRGVTELIVSTGGVYDPPPQTTPNPPTPLVRRDGIRGALRVDITPTTWSTQFVAEAGQTFTDRASGTCFDETDTPAPSGPSSTVTRPAPNTTVVSPVRVEGTATDDVGITGVRVGIRDRTMQRWLRADGTWSATIVRLSATVASPGARSTGWSLTAALPDGQYGVSVVAIDTASTVQSDDTWVQFTVS